jgi:NAD(P)-dependent dehydrogenase (short-subunit alcohol dehydrogenase family)
MSTKHQTTEIGKKPVWFITGCSTGFGRELAKHVLERGHRTVVTARDPADAHGLAAEGDALVLKLDVTDQGQIDAAIKTAEDRFGRIDVLVNNAGIGYFAAIEEGDDQQVRHLFDVNFFGLSRMIRAALPGMRRHKTGTIVNISSVGGLRSFPSLGYYSATKFAVEAYRRPCGRRLSPWG